MPSKLKLALFTSESDFDWNVEALKQKEGDKIFYQIKTNIFRLYMLHYNSRNQENIEFKLFIWSNLVNVLFT